MTESGPASPQVLLLVGVLNVVVPAAAPRCAAMIARIVDLLPHAAAGAALSGVYLALLWLAVRGVECASHPGALVLGGAVARIALVCAGLWLLSGGDGPRLLAAVGGFFVARSGALAVVRRSGRAAAPRPTAEPRR